MGEMAGGAAARKEEQALTPDNPLVPNRTLRRIYADMVESRTRAERTRRRKGGAETRGQEACRAAVLVGLAPEDSYSDVREASAAVLPQVSVLPQVEDTSQRLYTALGVALAAKRAKTGGVVVLFVGHAEAKRSLWAQCWRFAVAETLPVLFVALPPAGLKAIDGPDLGARSTAAGVPGIAVDAADAVALLRVAGECLAVHGRGAEPL